MKQMYSIQELVELQSIIQNANYPNNRQGFEYRAKKENWNFQVTKSTGRNGTKKLFLIPIELALIIEKHINPKPIIQTVGKLPKTISQPSNTLTDAQKEIAANKLIIVRYLEQKIKQGQKKTRVIQQFIDDANNQNLPTEMLETLNKANAKAGMARTVSRRSLFDWMKAVDDAERHDIELLKVLAPKARKPQDMPSWVIPFLKLWQQPQKPTITACLEQLPDYLNGSACPSYSQAYRFLKNERPDLQEEVDNGTLFGEFYA